MNLIQMFHSVDAMIGSLSKPTLNERSNEPVRLHGHIYPHKQKAACLAGYVSLCFTYRLESGFEATYFECRTPAGKFL